MKSKYCIFIVWTCITYVGSKLSNDTFYRDNFTSLFRRYNSLEEPQKIRIHDVKSFKAKLSPDYNVAQLRATKHPFKAQAVFRSQNVNFEPKNVYKIDPNMNRDFRRTFEAVHRSSSVSSSSSMELEDFKEEWKRVWLQKQIEAINSTTPRGDIVNMIAARPWGVSCGDPNQHDMPWGTCMMPMQCEPELRIYRGDYFCGRTQFVCCGVMQTAYDMYQGLVPSFEDSELETDSEEKRKREMDSSAERNRNDKRKRRKRRKERSKRKRKMRKTIDRIVKEMRKILNRAYRNGTRERKRKTKQLKQFIKDLKKIYKKERQGVKDIHDYSILEIDKKLQQKLDTILGVNDEFVSNDTFRQIVVNGTITKENARMLVNRYPELSPYFFKTRKMFRNVLDLSNEPFDTSEIAEDDSSARADLLSGELDRTDYDVEYGVLYH